MDFRCVRPKLSKRRNLVNIFSELPLLFRASACLLVACKEDDTIPPSTVSTPFRKNTKSFSPDQILLHQQQQFGPLENQIYKFRGKSSPAPRAAKMITHPDTTLARVALESQGDRGDTEHPSRTPKRTQKSTRVNTVKDKEFSPHVFHRVIHK